MSTANVFRENPRPRKDGDLLVRCVRCNEPFRAIAYPVVGPIIHYWCICDLEPT